MAAPEIDSTDGINIGNVLIHAGNVDGRDVSADGTKLDGVEASADVTDTTNILASGSLNVIRGWVEFFDYGGLTLGSIPANSYVLHTFIHVIVLFNDSGTDTISIGTTADEDGFQLATDVSSAGIKTENHGVMMGYNSSGQTIKAFYEPQNVDMDQGKALVGIVYFTTPALP